MLTLLKTWLDIALLRHGPDVLPDSALLLGVSLALYLLVQLPVGLAVYPGWRELGMAIVVDVGLAAGLVWLLLWVTGHAARYRQTLSALFGAGVILGLVMLPVGLAWQTGQGAAGALAVLALLGWTLAINAHILSRAVSQPFAVGLLCAIGWLLLQQSLLSGLAPEAA